MCLSRRIAPGGGRALVVCVWLGFTGLASTAGADTITATFTYQDRNGPQPIVGAQVRIARRGPQPPFGFWDWRTIPMDIRTDATGSINVTLDHAADGNQYMVDVMATNSAVTVRILDASEVTWLSPGFAQWAGEANPIVWTAWTPDAAPLDFSWHFADPNNVQFYNIAETIRIASEYVQARRDPSETDPLPPVSAKPVNGATNKSYYAVTEQMIVLQDERTLDGDDMLILHEYGHHVQTTISTNARIESKHNGCLALAPATEVKINSAELAWMEGSADWFAQAVARANPGRFFNLPIGFEAPTCSLPDSGDQIEVFISGSLWDLLDSPADLTFDPAETLDTASDQDLVIMQIWDRELGAALRRNPTIYDFRNAWLARGLDQPTIDDNFELNHIPLPAAAGCRIGMGRTEGAAGGPALLVMALLVGAGATWGRWGACCRRPPSSCRRRSPSPPNPA